MGRDSSGVCGSRRGVSRGESAFSFLAQSWFDAEEKMKDRTDEVREAVKRYEGVEFVPLRLEDAFDPEWWARIGQPSAADISVDLSTEGTSLPTELVLCSLSI